MPGKLLLVSPAFQGYWKSIASAWEQLGYDVETHCYDAYKTPRDKIRVKAEFELRDRLGLDGMAARKKLETTRAQQAVRDTRPDYVFVIKGDTLQEPFWAEIERAGAKKQLWLYDELRRTEWGEDRLRAVGHIASYSREDTKTLTGQGFDTAHLPLAFDPDKPFVPVPSREVNFIGARYPKREQQLVYLHEHGIPVRAYGRTWSSHPVDRLRTWMEHKPVVPAGRDLPLDEAWGRMAGAAATLNIHGDQDGFTMRTFEACGVGGVQLIDRPEVSEFYEPGVELLPYSSDEELLELAQRATKDFSWGAKIRDAGRKRTLAEHTFLSRMKEADAWWG